MSKSMDRIWRGLARESTRRARMVAEVRAAESRAANRDDGQPPSINLQASERLQTANPQTGRHLDELGIPQEQTYSTNCLSAAALMFEIWCFSEVWSLRLED